MHWARATVCIVAELALVACWFVAWSWSDRWSRPSMVAVGLELAAFAIVSTIVLAVALTGPRVLAVPAAVILMVYGWFGSWAYGFLWVPGAAALVGCALPRPQRPVFRRRLTVPKPNP
jgi:hypothetical protein